MEEGVWDVWGAHKNDTAVKRVRIPVMIISLGEGKCIDGKLNLVVPLPRLKPCSMNMQCAKADETRDDLSCDVYECLRQQKDSAFKPVPFIKTVKSMRKGVEGD